MIVSFSPRGWADYQHWLSSDQKVLARLNSLIEEVRRSPFKGTGKPEPLRNELKGWWSRRLTQEDRLVYRVEGKDDDQRLIIVQCRFHY